MDNVAVVVYDPAHDVYTNITPNGSIGDWSQVKPIAAYNVPLSDQVKRAYGVFCAESNERHAAGQEPELDRLEQLLWRAQNEARPDFLGEVTEPPKNLLAGQSIEDVLTDT
jgi:hypothetical protein